MNRKTLPKTFPLFLLYFLFQWGGQLAAAGASGPGEGASFFLIPLYLCFLSRGFLWVLILREMKLSFAYSLSSVGYLVIPVLSFLLLREPFKVNFLPGGLLILAGITLYGVAEQRVKGKEASR